MDFQTQVNLLEGVPLISLEYNVLTENLPGAEWGQTTESDDSESIGKRAERLCQSSNSSGDRERRKARSQLFAATSVMEMSGLGQYENKTGKLTARGASPHHQSLQKRTEVPLPTINLT